MKIHPLTLEDSQVHFILTGMMRGWFSKKQGMKALKKLRDKKIIDDNMYQARYVN